MYELLKNYLLLQGVSYVIERVSITTSVLRTVMCPMDD